MVNKDLEMVGQLTALHVATLHIRCGKIGHIASECGKRSRDSSRESLWIMQVRVHLNL